MMLVTELRGKGRDGCGGFTFGLVREEGEGGGNSWVWPMLVTKGGGDEVE